MTAYRNGRKVLDSPFIYAPEIWPDTVTKTDNYTVLQTDSGKVLVMNSASDKAFTVTAGYNIDTEFTFVGLGTGRVTIDMSGSETIDDSSAGGTIYTDDDSVATITINKVSSTAWVIKGATGTWTTT